MSKCSGLEPLRDNCHWCQQFEVALTTTINIIAIDCDWQLSHRRTVTAVCFIAAK